VSEDLAMGCKVWLVPDGYLPSCEPGDLVSHESICVLNTGTEKAHCKLDVFFEDRDPLLDIPFQVEAQRTCHLRLDRPDMLGGIELPRDVPYATRVMSDVPVVVQSSRLDVTQPNLALFTTMAFPCP